MADANDGALAGIRVLDFSRVLAGPFCTMILGDMGADIIKVENPSGGDDTRQWGPPWFGEGDTAQSAYFISVNRNKRSLTLNLKTETGRSLARQLAAGSDILVENFKPGQMADFELGYDDLRQINSRLIYCSITGFGQTGPYRDRPGYDYAVQAMSGLMSITGETDGSPMKVGVAVSDLFTGLFAVTSILAALHYRDRTGQGQYIDLALLDSQVAALANVASSYLVSGENPERLGNEHPNIVPYQTFRASDREFVIAVGNDRQFVQLCTLINRSDLFADARYATNPARVENRTVLIDELQSIFQQHTAAAWVEKLLAVGIPAGTINDIPTILNDPHIQVRGLVHQIEASNGAMLKLVGSPMNLALTPPQLRLPPPTLGQHTDEILRDMLKVDEPTRLSYRGAGII